MKDTLGDEHEQLGRAVTRIIADYARSLDALSVCSRATPSDLHDLFDEPLPIKGMDPGEILARFVADILPNAMQIPSPRYYGLFNPTPLPIAVWADALCSAINQNGAAWRNSPSASIIEARVLRWLCQLLGYDEGRSFGTLTSGGSEANLIALKCARDAVDKRIRDEGIHSAARRLVVYASEQCHYSFEKSVDILGLGRQGLRKISTDEQFQINVDELCKQITSDLDDGYLPCCIVGSAGSTSTGVIDPLNELAEIARRFNCWYHVDAAYGGSLAFSEKLKGRLNGIERADSITVDPHKWMFVPFACGAVLVRDGGTVLRQAFDITPEYLSEERKTIAGADVEYDFFRYGQLGTRRFNALKVWMAIKSLGVQGYAKIIERQIDLTNYLAKRIAQIPGFRCLGKVHTAVCCFAFMPETIAGTDEPLKGPALDRMQKELQQGIERSGGAWISTTVLHGRRALRVNINSFLTERRHLNDLVRLLERESAALSGVVARETTGEG